jgi:hypothetical protein
MKGENVMESIPRQNEASFDLSTPIAASSNCGAAIPPVACPNEKLREAVKRFWAHHFAVTTWESGGWRVADEYDRIVRAVRWNRPMPRLEFNYLLGAVVRALHGVERKVALEILTEG